nr:hypothetical protein [Tanacetum cinerariifolium]
MGSTRSLYSVILRESVNVWNLQRWWVSSMIVLEAMTIHFEVATIWVNQLGGSIQGVQPTGVLNTVLNAHKASSSLSLHKARFSPTVLLRIRFNPRFVTSTCPLVWGWYDVDRRWVTPYFAMTLENWSLQNKSHLIKDCDVYDNVANFPSVISKAASVPAGSRNSLASISAGRSIPAASRNRPASIYAGRHIPAGRFNKPSPFPAGRSLPTGWTNHAARLFFRPTNLYFNNVSWPGIYDYISMNEGRWGSTVKSSAAEKYGFEFSNETAKMLHQAKIETRRNLVLAVGDPAHSIVSTGGVHAGSVPAGSIPTSSVPASSIPTSSVPASSVPASSSEHSTRFPSLSDLGNHQPKAVIFSSSSYDDDFYADVTNLALSVAVDPVATKRV